MKILALDLSKFKSVGCVYEAESGEHGYRRVKTRPAELHDLLVKIAPDRVVIEVSSISGWVSDLVRALEIELQVVSTNGEAWRWRNVKQKHDQGDALKLARLSAMNQLELVHMPEPKIRQWRAVINYRQHLVGRAPRSRTICESYWYAKECCCRGARSAGASKDMKSW